MTTGTLNAWTTSDVTIFDTDARPWSKDLVLDVDAGTGTVEIQRLDSDGTTWTAVETISADEQKIVDMVNAPSRRFHATGDAQFRVTWRN